MERWGELAPSGARAASVVTVSVPDGIEPGHDFTARVWANNGGKRCTLGSAFRGLRTSCRA